MKLSENPHAKAVEDQMVLWLRHTVTSLEMVKAEELNRMIIESQPFVTSATWNSIKVYKWTRINGFNSLKMLTETLSDGCLKTDTSK